MEALQRMHNRGSISTGYEIYNSVKLEIDDTQESERLHWYHRSGTYTEFTYGGSRVENTAGHHFHSITGNLETILSGKEKKSISGLSFSKYDLMTLSMHQLFYY